MIVFSFNLVSVDIVLSLVWSRSTYTLNLILQLCLNSYALELECDKNL